jgi:predicted metal-binding membrane protein
MTTRASEVEDTVRGAVRAIDGRAVFHALMLGLVVAAWITLWLWSESPYSRYLDHGRWTDFGVAAAICRAIPAGDVLVPALLYAAGWLLMIAAMMLPTTLPVLEIFRRITAGRPDAGRLIGLVVAGYVCAWFAFGLAAHAADALLHAAAERTPWFVVNGWVIGVAVLGAAGLFQFSALKYRCLDKCRTPLGFVIEHWHGKAPAREALRLGIGHGAFCVGCCWALMLLMFVVGTGSVGWMLVLGAVMAAEKNLPGGQRLSAPLGVGLIAWAGVVLFLNLLPPAG